MLISTKEYRQILELVEVIQCSNSHNEMLQEVFNHLVQIVPFSRAFFMPVDYRDGFTVKDRGFLYNATNEILDLFFNKSNKLHPVLKDWGVIKHTNEVVRLSDFVHPSKLITTDYHLGFQKRLLIFHEAYAMLAVQDENYAIMFFARPKKEKDFSERDIAILNTVIPFLAKALQRVKVFEILMDSSEIGLIIHGGGVDNYPIFINEKAKEVLNFLPDISCKENELHEKVTFLQIESDTYRVKSTCSKDGRENRITVIEPFPPDYALHPRLKAFGLTKRQQEMATLVIRGFSNREIANRQCLSEQTVKDHIYDIFEKVNVHSRCELTAKVLGLT